MIIPSKPEDRMALYQQVLSVCNETRSDRREMATTLRNYYLFGARNTDGAAYNKIGSTVDTLWSFMYSAESTKFSMHLGTKATEGDLGKTTALVDEINDQWKTSKTNLSFGLGGKWSLVYGCILFKSLWTGSCNRTFVVEPHQFGVYREDVVDLDEQEAFAHFYQITAAELLRLVSASPNKVALVKQLFKPNVANEATGNSNMDRLILSAGVNTVIGGQTSGGGYVEGGMQNTRGGSYDYVPHSSVPMIDMAELYVWDDELNDYRIVTMAGVGEGSVQGVIFDRKNFGVPEYHPFTRLAPELESYDYFWGTSFVARLTRLQDWREDRMKQVRSLLDKQADPPMYGTGMTGIADEKFAAFGRAGSRLSGTSPTMKVDPIRSELPSAVFSEIQEIDQMFADAAGMGPILSGHSNSGVRTEGQANLMARLASSRVKQRALVAEEAAGRLATLMLHNVQHKSNQRFQSVERDPQGEPLTFVASQFTSDYEIGVDAHSTSPVFVEDLKAEASGLLKAGTITKERFLRMVDPPNLQMVLAELKLIEAKEEAMEKRKEELQAQALAARGRRKGEATTP